MRITVIAPHFAPDVAPTGEVMTSIVEHLAERGHRLHVVTSLPWYRHHRIEHGWHGRLVRREDTDWGRITRVHPFPTDKTNIPARALAFGAFTVLAGLAGLLHRERPDAVVAMSPPLTLGLAGWLVARARRAPFLFNIQDVFPDVAIEAGVLRGGQVIRAAHGLERFTYRRADAVTVLSEDLAANLRAKLGPRDDARVRVIPNFIDTGRIAPGPRLNSYRSEFELGERTVVMYAGNLGYSQPVGLALEAARRLVGRDDLVFVVNGAGSARSALEAEAADLPNVRFVDLQPRERLPDVLAAGDVHLVLLRSGFAHSSVPSKLYSILAAARPVVASVDPGTEVARVVEAAGAGVAVDPDDPDALVKAVLALVDDPERRSEMAAAGRAFVETWPSPADVARRYEDLLQQLRREAQMRRAGQGPGPHGDEPAGEEPEERWRDRGRGRRR
jgi:putative colanic acid biosynthesis glycosyltransferase WcaI